MFAMSGAHFYGNELAVDAGPARAQTRPRTAGTGGVKEGEGEEKSRGGATLIQRSRSELAASSTTSHYASGRTPPLSADEANRHRTLNPSQGASSLSSSSSSSSKASLSASTSSSTTLVNRQQLAPSHLDLLSTSPSSPLSLFSSSSRSRLSPTSFLSPPSSPGLTEAHKRPSTADSLVKPFTKLTTSTGDMSQRRPSASHDMAPSYSAPQPSVRSHPAHLHDQHQPHYPSPTRASAFPSGSTNGNKASQMLGMMDFPHNQAPSYRPDSTSPPTTSSGSVSTLKSSTLKKARSLFSSHNSRGKSPDYSGLPSPPMVPSSASSSPQSHALYHSKSHGSLASSTNQYARGPQSAYTDDATHGSPQPGYRFPGDPYPSPSPNRIMAGSPSSASHQYASGHPYAATTSSQRKASSPSAERRKKPSEDKEDEPCPVCLESLSIRLQGEKPHVVPMCGHRLHAECFETAYGTPSPAKGGRRKGPLGICGICRSEMKISEDGGGKSKFAALSGQPDHSAPDPMDTHKIRSISKHTLEKDGISIVSLHDPSEDHDIVNPHQYLPAYMQHIALGASRNGHPSPQGTRTMPRITVRAEHPSIARSADPEKKMHLTCMVTVEIPSRVVGANTSPSFARSHLASNSQSTILAVSSVSGTGIPPRGQGERRESNVTTGTEDFPTSPSVSAFSGSAAPAATTTSAAMENSLSHASSSSRLTPCALLDSSSHTTPESTGMSAGSLSSSSGLGHITARDFAAANVSNAALTAAAQEEKDREAHGPFASVFEDLQTRMADWKGHEPANFGSLRMWDTLQVRKDKNIREFVVYLFEEALLCVVDDRKKKETGSDRLRLKGRVFVRHMHRVEETSSVDSGLSLTIQMEDDSLESFVVLFRNRETLEVWRSQIQALIDHHRPPVAGATSKLVTAQQAVDAGSLRRDSVFSAGTSRSGQSATSRLTRATTAPSFSERSAKDLGISTRPAPVHAVPPLPTASPQNHPSSDALRAWQPPSPDTFVPVDLMLVISVPPPASGPSSSSLRLRLIKSTLDSVIHSVGPRARISIVAYTVGDPNAGVSLRKTPWLATGRADGIGRLEQAINEIAGERASMAGEGLTTVDSKEDRITVASAVNLALDIALQRENKSATSGMIILNDGKDGAQKQQIDLVMTRADAGRIPIHCFGWGKAHDPSSLWLLSNHTKGTYTFVKDYYQLQDAIAGCVGGMLSVATAGLKLHLNVQERRWFKIRKVAGVGTAIVSSDGKDVDITLGELRYGEKKEMLVEIEMASPKSTSGSRTGVRTSALSRKASMTATDDFFLKRAGLDPDSFTDLQQDFYNEVEDGMAEDVPIFEVIASFRDPLDLEQKSHKLPYPALLTTTVAPPSKNGSDSPTVASGIVSDPTIVRRRMELLTSDMITRTLLLMSRRQDAHAQRLLTETTRIFGAIIANLSPPSADENPVTPETCYAQEVLLACLEDVEHLRIGCMDRAEFEQVTRNYGAQQAVALRDQRAWTDRSATESLFFCKEWTAILRQV